MKSNRLRILITEIIVSLFILLFLYTGLTKLKDIRTFRGAMMHSPVLGPYARPLSWIVPTIELATASLLIIPRARFAGLIMATVMMALFTGYIAYMLKTASVLPCTCGGIIQSMSWRQHLIFNLAFLSIGIVGTIWIKKNFIRINRSSRIPVENSRQPLNQV